MVRVHPHDGKKFDVRFDPAQVTVQQMLEAVSRLKYRPGVEGSISAAVDTPAMKAEARSADAALRPKSDGEIVVKLSPKSGQQLGGEGATPTKVVVVGTEQVTVPGGEVAVSEAVTAEKELRIPISVAKGTPDGEQLLTVRVTFQSKRGGTTAPEKTVEFQVPVIVR